MVATAIENGTPERGGAIAAVSEHSRSVARIPVHRQVRQLENEREALALRKRELESELSKLGGRKKNDTSKVLSRNLPKSKAIEETCRIESDFIAKKAPIVSEIHAIEGRLFEIRQRLNVAARERSIELREDIEILRRIEKLLIILVERTQTQMDFKGTEL